MAENTGSIFHIGRGHQSFNPLPFWLVLGGLLSAFWAAGNRTASAMPTFRYDENRPLSTGYILNMDGWVALTNDPIYRNSFEALFMTRPMPDTGNLPRQTLQIFPDRTLSRSERREMRSLYDSLASDARGDGISTGVFVAEDNFGGDNPSGNGDLLGELTRDAEKLYSLAGAEEQKPDTNGNGSLPPNDDGNMLASVQSSSPGEFPVLTIRQRKTTSDQALLEMPLGVLGAEALKPILQISGMLSGTLQELRQYVLIQQPKSSMLMMLNNDSGQAVVMQTHNSPLNELRNNQISAENRTPAPHDSTPSASGAATNNFFNKPLPDLLWAIASSDAAVFVYFLLFISWLAWRRLIRRHV